MIETVSDKIILFGLIGKYMRQYTGWSGLSRMWYIYIYNNDKYMDFAFWSFFVTLMFALLGGMHFAVQQRYAKEPLYVPDGINESMYLSHWSFMLE